MKQKRNRMDGGKMWTRKVMNGHMKETNRKRKEENKKTEEIEGKK